MIFGKARGLREELEFACNFAIIIMPSRRTNGLEMRPRRGDAFSSSPHEGVSRQDYCPIVQVPMVCRVTRFKCLGNLRMDAWEGLGSKAKQSGIFKQVVRRALVTGLTRPFDRPTTRGVYYESLLLFRSEMFIPGPSMWSLDEIMGVMPKPD